MADDLIKALRNAVDKRANHKGYQRYMSHLAIWELAWKAAETITNLQSENVRLRAELERVTKERDAAELTAYKKVVEKYREIEKDEEKYPEQYDVICALNEWLHDKINGLRGLKEGR